MRIAVDTGGTFTDLMLEDDEGQVRLFKSSTTPGNPIEGMLDVLDVAAHSLEMDRSELLVRSDMFIHGTTRAINAILTGATAKTAFLTTEGHPDVLVFREGQRSEPFNYTRPYPQPYVPRSLTFEVPERIGPDGEVVVALDEQAAVEIGQKLAQAGVEAVGVCLLWSIANPVHELRVGELLDEHLPGVPYTLSHALNPTIREYRRASSTVIDASLKPVMTSYLSGFEAQLREAGFRGRVLMVTSAGGMLDASSVAEAPIHSIGSGPAMAPVAGRYYAQTDVDAETAVVADAGGTSYDVSLVRRGRIPWTRETWLSDKYFGHMTGFPSVDVKSIGAGGGSIAWVDEGGLLHVGPQSAGAVPGPVCYGRGGTSPTVTDASLVLGYIDPNYFLAGAMQLDLDAARTAIEREVAKPLGLSALDAAVGVLRLATEHMVRAIEEITLNQGIDPRAAILVGGGGAAGLNAVAIARLLGFPRVVIPRVAAGLSATGALMSELVSDFSTAFVTTSSAFDRERVNAILADLATRCRTFAAGPGAGARQTRISLSAEARYPHQIWELEVPLRVQAFTNLEQVERLEEDFHEIHEEVFAIRDADSPIEIVSWRARVRCRLRDENGSAALPGSIAAVASTRRAYFRDTGLVDARVRLFEAMEAGEHVQGPAIVEAAATTVVLDPGSSAQRTLSGSLSIAPLGEEPSSPQGGSKRTGRDD